MAEDFFVRFGSDAARFGKQLDQDLAGARRTINTFARQLQDLETTAANRRAATMKHLAAMSTEATRVQNQISQLEAAQSSVGVSPESSDVHRIQQEVYQSIGSVTAQLDGMMDKLGQTVTRIGQAGDAFKAAQETETRATAQRTGGTTQANNSQKFPAGTVVGQLDQVTKQYIRAFDKAGRELAEGTKVGGRYAPKPEQLGLTPGSPIPGAISADEFRRITQASAVNPAELARALAGATPAGPDPAQIVQAVTQSVAGTLPAMIAQVVASTVGGQQPTAEVQTPVRTPVALEGIPQVTIEEAAFQRIVTAVEKNVTATGRVEKAVDRIGALLKGEAASAPDEAPAAAGDPGGKLSRDEKSELYSVFRDELDRTRKESGEPARDAMWKSIVEQQVEAKAKGASIYSKTDVERAVEATENKPTKRQSALAKQEEALAGRDRELRNEVERLATAEAETGKQSQELTRALNEQARVEQQLASVRTARAQDESKAAQQERQRRDAIRRAQAEAGIRIDPDERRRREDERGRLELATRPEELAARTGRGPGQFKKSDLQDIAETLTRQGYGVDLGNQRERDGRMETRLSNEQLIERIGQAGARYLQSGRATAEDLSLRRVSQAPTELSPELARFVQGGELGAATQKFTQELGRMGLSVEQFYRAIGQNVFSGGESPMRDKVKGRLEMGAMIGDERRDEILAARDRINAYQSERSGAARNDVIRTLRERPFFDPEDLRGELPKGRDETAQNARRNLAALDQAVAEVDRFAKGLHELDDSLASVERWRSRILRQMQEFEEADPTTLTKRDHDSQLRAMVDLETAGREITERRQNLERYMSTWKDPDGGTADFLLDPAARQGTEMRTGDRAFREVEAERERTKALEKMERRRALQDSTAQFFGGARVFATNEGNTRDYFSRTLPGVRVGGGRGRTRLEFADDEMNGTPENRKAIASMTAGMLGYTSRLNKLIEATADSESTEEELNDLREKTAQALQKLLGAYERTFKNGAAPSASLLLPEELGFDNNFLERAASSIDPETGKVTDRFAMQQIQREDAGAARAEKLAERDQKLKDDFKDPARAEALGKQRDKALGKSIDTLNAEIKTAADETKAYGRAARVAEKTLRENLGAKSLGRIGDLQGSLDKLQTQEAKWVLQERHMRPEQFPTGAADLEANYAEQARVRASIQKEYDATPATREAASARDVATAQHEYAQALEQAMRTSRELLQLQRRGVTVGQVELREKLHAATTRMRVAQEQLDGTPGAPSSKENRERIARRLRVLGDAELQGMEPTGTPRKQDVARMQERVAQSGERMIKAEERLDRATKQLTDAREQLAEAERAHRAEAATTTVDTGYAKGSQSEYLDLLMEREEEIKNRMGVLSRIAPTRDEMFDDEGRQAADDYDTERMELRRELAQIQSVRQQHELPLLAGKRPETITMGVTELPGAEDLDKDEIARRNRLRGRINHYEEVVSDATSSLRGLYATQEVLEVALERMIAQYNAQDAKRGTKAEGPLSGGSGSGGNTPPPTQNAGADEPGGPGNQDIFVQMLAALNRIDGKLAGTLRVAGSIDPAGAPGSPNSPRNQNRLPRSTPAGRSDFEASIGQTIPAFGQFISAGKNVDAAVELIKSGMSETRVFDLFRDKLDQNTEAAKKFQTAVRGQVGDDRLNQIADAAAQEKARQEAAQFPLRDGKGTVTQDEARTEMQADLDTRKRQAQRLAETTAAQREAAQAALIHAQALGKLAPATQKEIVELERMARETNDTAEAQERLARQMTKVYGMTSQNLLARGGNATEVNQTAASIFKGVNIDASGQEVQRVRAAARSLGYQVDQGMAMGISDGDGMLEQVAGHMFGPRGFWGRVIGSTGAFIVRNFTAGAVFGLTNALQDLLMQAIQAEAIFVRVSDALNETGTSTDGLRSDLRGLSTEYGVALQDVYETAAGLTGLFDNTDDLKAGVEVVTQLQRISMGALNANEAMGILSATIGGFSAELGSGVDGMTHVADVLTTIQNNLGVNVEVSAEGVGRMAGLAQNLKIDFEDTAVYVAQIAKLTNQTGASAGEQFSRVLGVMQTGRGRSALIENLPGSGVEQQLAEGEYGDVLQTMLENWNNLTDAQQRNLVVTLGGQRQAATLGALFNDTAKVLETTAKAHDASGAAARRNEEIMKTMNAQVGVLQANFSVLADNLLDSGIANSLGVILRLVNGLLGAVNTVLNGMNTLADKSGFAEMLLTWGTGITGLLLLLGAMSKALMGLKASMTAMRGMAIGEGIIGAAGAGGAAGAERTGFLRQGAQSFVNVPLGGAARAESFAARANERATSAAEAGSKRAALAHSAVGKAATGASKASLGVANGFDKLGAAGLAAQLGVGLLVAGIVTLVGEFQRSAAHSEAFKARVKKQDAGDAETDESGDPYYGPNSTASAQNKKDTDGLWSMYKSFLRAPFDPANMGSISEWKDVTVLGGFQGMPNYLDELQGNLPEEYAEKLDKLHFEGLTKLNDQRDKPQQLAAEVEATNEEVNKMLEDARDAILSSGMSDPQKEAGLAILEQYKTGYDAYAKKLILKAQNIVGTDDYTSTQMAEIAGISSMLQANAGLGLERVNEIAAAMAADLGLDQDSQMALSLEAMGTGASYGHVGPVRNKLDMAEAGGRVGGVGHNAADMLEERAKQLELDIENAYATREAMLSGEKLVEDGEIEAQQQLIEQKTAELISTTEQMLQSIISGATAIADLAMTRGDYGGAADTIQAAIERFHAARSPGESPEVAAGNDLIESQGAERAAQAEAQGNNARLEASKARGLGARASVMADEKIARNNLDALLNARRAARLAGTEPPSIQAIRDAKNAWYSAQRQSTLAAQNSSIALLSLALAKEWNALAAAGISEQIALQQYQNAKANFGAGSDEAIAAATTLASQRKSTMQTQDQVAEAQRQAMLAAIPPGNTMAIARQTLANARAALAAASKYEQDSVEYQNALAAMRQAQYGLAQAEANLIQSRTGIAIALAQAAGNTVKAAMLQIKAARQALAAALKNSGGAESDEVNNARAGVISAQAAARDARLQDDLDTIDFNLEMGRMTQSAAISALRQILRTQDLTKAQRRQLLLQIKGMQESMSDSQWNFGDIKMPTPYQMRRFSERNRRGMQDRLREMQLQMQDAAAAGGIGGGAGGGSVVNNQTTITIHAGTDVRKVEEVVRRAVGHGHRTRTATPRRR